MQKRADQALVTLPAFRAFAETQMRFTWPLGRIARTRCRLGLKVRLFHFVTCIPMPPLLLAIPFRRIRPPRTGCLPVIAQILDMDALLVGKGNAGK